MHRKISNLFLLNLISEILTNRHAYVKDSTICSSVKIAIEIILVSQTTQHNRKNIEYWRFYSWWYKYYTTVKCKLPCTTFIILAVWINTIHALKSSATELQENHSSGSVPLLNPLNPVSGSAQKGQWVQASIEYLLHFSISYWSDRLFS